MSFLRTVVRRVFVAIVALVLLFEEWGWEPLAALVARLAKLPLFAWLEKQIRILPPYAALGAFFVPALLLVPVKIAALFFIAHGHGWLGLGVLLAAKIVGTALVARLFALTQATLMQLAWFAHWYPRWKAWKDRIMEEVRASPVWQAARRIRAGIAEQWAQLIRGSR
ncbi:MAG TPA: hypothetical protein VL593_04255 [Ramlibacter sp.]|jgi:hypothetical protein|nr:hypothetical protein [Ramlibacter sp.]